MDAPKTAHAAAKAQRRRRLADNRSASVCKGSLTANHTAILECFRKSGKRFSEKKHGTKELGSVLDSIKTGQTLNAQAR